VNPREPAPRAKFVDDNDLELHVIYVTYHCLIHSYKTYRYGHNGHLTSLNHALKIEEYVLSNIFLTDFNFSRESASPEDFIMQLKGLHTNHHQTIYSNNASANSIALQIMITQFISGHIP
jgi:hypothetical protein